jgi:hypothetical protein
MIDFYGSGLFLLALWIATSLLVVLCWGLLAWGVVRLLEKHERGRNPISGPGDRSPTDDRSPHGTRCHPSI